MYHKIPRTAAAAALIALGSAGFSGMTRGDEHTAEARKHAEQAIRSIGDAQSISEHASDALIHLDAAKSAQAADPEAVRRLEQVEADLNDAVTKARRFNSVTATEEAEEAIQHLDQAADAVGNRSGAVSGPR